MATSITLTYLDLPPFNVPILNDLELVLLIDHELAYIFDYTSINIFEDSTILFKDEKLFVFLKNWVKSSNNEINIILNQISPDIREETIDFINSLKNMSLSSFKNLDIEQKILVQLVNEIKYNSFSYIQIYTSLD